MLSVAYPLSVGPVAWLAHKGILPETPATLAVTEFIYSPVFLVATSNKWTYDLYVWYVMELWCGDGQRF